MSTTLSACQLLSNDAAVTADVDAIAVSLRCGVLAIMRYSASMCRLITVQRIALHAHAPPAWRLGALLHACSEGAVTAASRAGGVVAVWAPAPDMHAWREDPCNHAADPETPLHESLAAYLHPSPVVWQAPRSAARAPGVARRLRRAGAAVRAATMPEYPVIDTGRDAKQIVDLAVVPRPSGIAAGCVTVAVLLADAGLRRSAHSHAAALLGFVFRRDRDAGVVEELSTLTICGAGGAAVDRMVRILARLTSGLGDRDCAILSFQEPHASRTLAECKVCACSATSKAARQAAERAREHGCAGATAARPACARHLHRGRDRQRIARAAARPDTARVRRGDRRL